MKISFIIPLYNEQGVLHELLSRLYASIKKDFLNYEAEVICIDDGSKDATYASLCDYQKLYASLKIVKFSRNFGHHKAISAGLDFCTGDYAVLMDGDLQDQPEEIVKLFEKLLAGYDVVYGMRQDKQFSYFKKLRSSLFTKLMQWMLDEKIQLNSSIFRIMTRQVVNKVVLLREQNRFVLGLIGWVGFKTTHVGVVHGKRFSGQSKYSLKKEIKLALDTICAFSDYPLRLISRMGFLLMVISGLSIVLLIFNRLMYGTGLMGWTSTMCVIIFFSGMQMLVLGVVGEYIGRIYVEVKNRPLYIIEKSHGFSDKKELSEYSRKSNNRGQHRFESI